MHSWQPRILRLGQGTLMMLVCSCMWACEEGPGTPSQPDMGGMGGDGASAGMMTAGGQGGDAGNGGSGGEAGNAGTAGDGGQAGTGGEAGNAGTGGEAGNGGTGGDVGTGGSAGDGGQAGDGGEGGSTGMGGTGGTGGDGGQAGVGGDMARCGDGQLDENEECDEDAEDCLDCEVLPTDIGEGGAFDGHFQAGGFDLYDLDLDTATIVDLISSAGDPGRDCPEGVDLFFVLKSGERSLVEEDEGGFSNCARIQRALAPGQYTLVVNDRLGRSVDGYTLSVTLEQPLETGDECDPFTNLCPPETSCIGSAMGPPVCVEVGCGNDRIDFQSGEECDEAAPDCIDCRVQATDVSESGSFPGSFQGGSFDLFAFELATPTQLRLETNNGRQRCFVDTAMALYEVLPDGERRELRRSEGGLALCAVLDLVDEDELETGRYEVKVWSSAPVGIEDYAFVLSFVGGVCGDGVVNLEEACDDGNNESGDGCDANCTVTACGNGIVSIREACDDGNDQNDDDCDNNCTPPGCGNGIVNQDEQCDDANRINGDGCDRACTHENYELLRAEVSERGSFAVNRRDTWSFSVDAVSQLHVQTGGEMGDCPAGIDTHIALFRLQGDEVNEVAQNEDIQGGMNLCSGLDLPDLGSGSYQLVVTGRDNSAIADYWLHYRLTRNISEGGTFQGTTPNGGSDLYVLLLERERSVIMETFPPPGLWVDTVMTVVDADGMIVALSDDVGFGFDCFDCSRMEELLPPGTYFAELSGVEFAPLELYDLSVILGEREVCDDEMDNDHDLRIDCADDDCRHLAACACEDDAFEGEAIPVLFPGVYPDLQLCRDDEDRYQISVDPACELNVEVRFIHADGDLSVHLDSQDGLRLTSVNSSDDDESLSWSNPGGDPVDAYLTVAGWDGGENAYALQINTVCP